MTMQNSSLKYYSSVAIAAIASLAIAAALRYKNYVHSERRRRFISDDSHPLNITIWNRIVLLFCCRQNYNIQTVMSHFDADEVRISQGGYESLIGNTPLVYLPHLTALLNNNVRIYAKMENMNPGGTGKDRAAWSMIMAAEKEGRLPPPLSQGGLTCHSGLLSLRKEVHNSSPSTQLSSLSKKYPDIHKAILIALHTTKTNGIIIEGTSGSTGIALASISCSRGHAVIVVMPDDQSSQKAEFLERLGCGVVVVKNCSISNQGHYVNVAKMIWELVEIERRYDDYFWRNNRDYRTVDADHPPRLIKAAFMNQFENLANLHSHYSTTGPEIFSQVRGKVDAFVMSAGTGGTIVGVGGYLKDKWWMDHGTYQQKCLRSPPKIVLVDPPGSSLYNKIKFGVAYAPQQSEQRLRRHRYDTLAEGIGLDRITANFRLGCENVDWSSTASVDSRGQSIGSFGKKMSRLLNNDTSSSTIASFEIPTQQSKVIDDAVTITDQQAIYMAHYLLRHEGLFVGSSSAMNLVGALMVAKNMPPGSNVITIVCDGGQRHTARFWNKTFVEEQWGLLWPETNDRRGGDDSLQRLGILE